MTISEIKNTAKTKLQGSYLKTCSATLIYFIFVLILNFFENIIIESLSNSIITTLISAVFAIISILLSYGILANILDLVDIKTNSITDFINISIKNTTKYLKVILSILLKILIPLIIFLFSGFYLVGTSIAKLHNQQFLCFYPNLINVAFVIFILTFLILIYFLIKYTLSPYIYHEKSEVLSKNIVNTSSKLMKGKKGKFILLMLSFFNWLLIGTIILFILNQFIPAEYITPFIVLFYSFLKPYIVVSQSIFYEDCKDEAKENK